MYDFDNSLHMSFVKSNLIGWNNANDEFSQDVSQLNKIRENSNFYLMSMPNQPPRPGNNLYSCIESQQSEESVIKEVPYVGTDNENKLTKQVNSKQYFRMMKMRIKKGMQQILKGQEQDNTSKKKYQHESRHNHAVARLRGKDGKFLATRPAQQRFREKKKRGRKPKNSQPYQVFSKGNSYKTDSTPLKQGGIE